MKRGGPTYTIDTVEQLLADRPGDELFLVVGYDAALFLDGWHRVDELRELVTLVVVNRPRFDEVVDVPGWKVEVVDVPSIDVSSSMVRERLAAGLPVDGLVPGRRYARATQTRPVRWRQMTKGLPPAGANA